jgi:mannose/fructose-specific phosphotransferase system component IIA
MSDLLRGVVVCHGDVAVALVAATEEISGVRGALTAVSNRDCDRGRLEERIVAAAAGEPAIVFVDMAAGSCLFAAARRLAGLPGARIVTGVNLAMLLDFVFHRQLSVGDAAQRAVDAGGKAISLR